MVATLLSFLILGRFVLQTRGGYRKQALAVFSGGFVVYLAVAGYFTFGPGMPYGFDPTPLFNAAMAIIVSFALFRLDFLDVVPVASDRLFEEMSDPVVVLASNDTIAASNPAASALADEPLDGRELAVAIPELADSLETDQERVTLETDDGERTYDVETSPLFDPYGRQRGRLAVLRDVTLQRERERQLERQNDQLDRFAGVVSHDLRNPLAVGRGWAEQARDTGDVEHVDRTLSAFDDMERLIDDLLTLAREGRTVDETEWVALGDVAADAWPFPDGGPTLLVESTGAIEADPDRLGELLGNCFRNARDHGSDDVRVWIGVQEDGFYVEDDGPGIPAEERADVFESGYTTGTDGTGLGLSIVESIAQAHGWEICLEEGRTGGARFEITGANVEAAEGAPSNLVATTRGGSAE
jgi:signal transduction histidine kinase